MQRVLSTDLWKAVKAQARKARRRKAAIAYVTRDLVGFRKGDTLVLNASVQAIASGETDAHLLRTLQSRGVLLLHNADLHAKVILFDEIAVVSSGNMSNSSARCLVEAAVMTDYSSTVAGVASFIEQLVQQSEKLDAEHIRRLCGIKVTRRGGHGLSNDRHRRKTRLPPLGNRTWLVGVERVRKPSLDEQEIIDTAAKSLPRHLKNSNGEPDWICWTGNSRFAKGCRKGDSIIRIWHSKHAKRASAVSRAVPVLLKLRADRAVWLFLRPLA